MTIFRSTISGPGPEGDVWNITLHTSSSQTLAAVQTVMETFCNSFLGGTMKPMWPAVTSASSLVTDSLDPVTGKNTAQVQTPLAITGTGTGNALPQRIAVVTGLRTALPTRAGRGRMFVPSPDITHYDVDGLFIVSDTITIANGLANALNVLSATAVPVIYHRLAKTFTPITSVTVGRVAGNQRRRTNKVANDYAETAL